MTRHITVDSDRLDDFTTRFAASIEQIDAALDTLEAQAGRLRGAWEGEAADAYDRAHRQWDASIREMQGIVKEVARITAVGSSKFRALEKANAAVWPS